MALGMSKVVHQVPQLRRGIVRCTVCGREEHVGTEGCLQQGWPKCCGYTMTIDSPEERAAMAKAKS